MKSTTQPNTHSSRATLIPARASRKVLANPITPPLACAVFLWAVLGLGITQPALAQGYLQTNLVSDVPGKAALTDTNLMGAWGVVHSATSPWWVNSTAGHVSLIFNGAGQPIPLVVPVPPTGVSAPTGIAFNGGTNFLVAPGKPARFIFATLNGVISGWNSPTVEAIAVDNSASAAYTGLTIARQNGQDTLYAANFNQGTIDVFNSNFAPVTLPQGAFVDSQIPSTFTVFNVLLVNGQIYVTYAPKNVFGNSDAPGQGFVDAFDTSGNLLLRLRGGFWMNAPWGVALAPAGFGQFSNHLLVGMFGNGQIAAFDTKHGNFHGLLRGPDDQPVTIGTGLWGLGFGNGANAGPTNSLYFAADFVQNGFHGIFGAITAAPETEDDSGD